MEETKAQKSVSKRKVFKIPINEYEEDIETKLSNEKREEIYDLFNNHNLLKSERDFEEIKEPLHYACQECDLELIKILLSDTFRNYYNGRLLIFKINKTNNTASIIKVQTKLEELIVPRTVE